MKKTAILALLTVSSNCYKDEVANSCIECISKTENTPYHWWYDPSNGKTGCRSGAQDYNHPDYNLYLTAEECLTGEWSGLTELGEALEPIEIKEENESAVTSDSGYTISSSSRSLPVNVPKHLLIKNNLDTAVEFTIKCE